MGAPAAGTPGRGAGRGRAFTFGYAEHAELLRAAGAEVVEFDPLAEALPAQTAALVLPGGFPEQYLPSCRPTPSCAPRSGELARQAPVHAECGGLTYLMTDLDGHPMCGVLAGSARFTAAADPGLPRRGGGRGLVAAPGGRAGRRSRIPPHDSRIRQRAGARLGVPAGPGPPVRDGAIRAGVHASYLHTHAAAQPPSVARFVGHAAALTKLAR